MWSSLSGSDFFDYLYLRPAIDRDFRSLGANPDGPSAFRFKPLHYALIYRMERCGHILPSYGLVYIIYSLMRANEDVNLLSSLFPAAYHAHTPTRDKQVFGGRVARIMKGAVAKYYLDIGFNGRPGGAARDSKYTPGNTKSCFEKLLKEFERLHPHADHEPCPASLAAEVDTFAADDEFDNRLDEDEESLDAYTVPASEPDSEVLVLRDIIPEGFVVEDEEPLTFDFTESSV